MKTQIFAAYDKRVNCYMPMFNARTAAEAIRMMQNVLQDERSQIAKFPQDYTLCSFGTFDDSNGEIKPTPPNIVVEIDMLAEAMGGEEIAAEQIQSIMTRNGTAAIKEGTENGAS